MISTCAGMPGFGKKGDVIIPIMVLTLQEVEHIAELARLELTAQEKERFREQLSSILEYAARLQEIDTLSILPTYSVVMGEGQLREDEPGFGLSLEELLSNAPQVMQRQFRLPPVLE